MAIAERFVGNELVIAIVGLVVVSGGGAAAYVAAGGAVPFVGGADDGTVGTVPEGVDFVLYADPGVRSDETTKRLVNGLIDVANDRSDYDGPNDYAELQEIAAEDSDADIDIDDLQSAVVYGTYPDVSESSAGDDSERDYVGAVIDSEWSEAQFLEIVENGSAYERDEYEGYTIYVQRPTGDEGSDGTGDAVDPTYVGVLGDGEYVVGTEAAVTDALDVDAGDAAAFGGRLRESYDETREGYLRFAMRVPEPSDVTPATGAVLTDAQFGAFRNLSTVAGSYYTDGDAIGMELRLGAGTADDAEDLQAVLQGTLALTEESMRTREMARLIESTTVERDGTSVVVTFQRPVAEIMAAVEAGVESWDELSRFSSGFGASGDFADASRATASDDGAARTTSD